jgi:hypothetical protein
MHGRRKQTRIREYCPTNRTTRWQFLYRLAVGFEMDAPDPFVCVVPNTAEPLGSLRSNWESIVGEAFGYYDSSAVAEVAATVPIALNIGLIELHILTVQAAGSV